ncbi:MAG: glycosyltransferase family 2 protein [Candidatus Paceibacterota bacterium]
MDSIAQKPLISINICTFNRAKLISKAIESALAQNYLNIEIIIVDDNSTDNTEEIVKNFTAINPNIFYYKNAGNIGITKNRNFGLQKSQGKYIAVLDSDDYWLHENKLTEQVEFLEQNPDYALVGTFTKVVDSEDKEISTLKPETTDESIREKILLQNQFTHSSVLFRKDSLPTYNEKYFIWEDLAAWLDIGRNFKFANLPKIYTAYKKHGTNISQTRKIKGVRTLGQIINDHKNHYPHSLKASLKNKLRLIKSII